MEWFWKWSIGVVGVAFRRLSPPFAAFCRLLRGGEWTEWTEWTERTKTPGRRPAFQRRQSGKWTVGGALSGGWREKWLCSITRIYTHLHAFTQSFWAVTWGGKWSVGVVE